MTTNTTEPAEREKASITDRVAQGTRHAVHFSHQARAVKSLAEDIIDDRVHSARRWTEKGMRRSIEMLEDLKDEGTHYVKRQPLKAVAITAGIALMVGLGAGWAAARLNSSRGRTE